MISLLLTGMIIGLLAGLLGIGGGTIIVPVLLWIFQVHNDIPKSSFMHVAIGISLAIIVITSIPSIMAHHRHVAIQWFVVRLLAPGWS